MSEPTSCDTCWRLTATEEDIAQRCLAYGQRLNECDHSDRSADECPDPSQHGNPFRYCPYCAWQEPAVEDPGARVWDEHAVNGRGEHAPEWVHPDPIPDGFHQVAVFPREAWLLVERDDAWVMCLPDTAPQVVTSVRGAHVSDMGTNNGPLRKIVDIGVAERGLEFEELDCGHKIRPPRGMNGCVIPAWTHRRCYWCAWRKETPEA